jgi:predicted RNA-binding protein with PUA-like domain
MLFDEKIGEWEGVRNYQARNIMKTMKIGDEALFYNSNCGKNNTGIVGIMKIVKEHYPDKHALNTKSKYYDLKSSEENNKWVSVGVEGLSRLNKPILLKELKELKSKEPTGALKDLVLLKNSRLSVQVVTEIEWNYLLNLK